MGERRGASINIRAGVTRRQFIYMTGASALALAGGDLLLAACGGTSPSTGGTGTSTVRVQLNWLKNVQFAGEWIADDSGYYKDAGIAANFIAGGPNAPRSETVVVGGQADIGMSSFMQTTIDAIIAGADLAIFAAVFQHSPLALMSTPSRPIRTAQDMVGKRIGGPPFLQGNVDTLFKVNGLPIHYTFVPVNGIAPDPLLSNQLDAMYVFLSNQPLLYKQKVGSDPVLLPDSDNKFDIYSQIYFATKSYLKSHRQDVINYMHATVRGWEKSEQDASLGAKLAVQKYGPELGLAVDEQTSENAVQNQLAVSDYTKAHGMLRMDKARVEGPIYTALKAAGETKLPAVDSIIDTSIMDDVFGSKTSL